MERRRIDLDTSSRRVTDVTPFIDDFCRGRGDGVVNVLVPHATAGLALMELGSGSESDLEELVDRILPRDDRYVHAHGSRGHGADHLLPVLLSPTMSLPVASGRPCLGTWQSVALVDFNRDNPKRHLDLSFLEG